MRIGIYGGTFDPVHLGHLLLAEICREECVLDRVRFIPAAQSPHKRGRVTAPGVARVEMLRLAIAGHPSLEVSTWELDQGGISYTVDTLRHLHSTEPGHTWFFLLGGDSLEEFPTWREPLEICRLATLVVVDRPQAIPADIDVLRRIDGWNDELQLPPCRVLMPQLEISSSEIRERVRSGRSIRFRTPRAVEAYITANKVYP